MSEEISKLGQGEKPCGEEPAATNLSLHTHTHTHTHTLHILQHAKGLLPEDQEEWKETGGIHLGTFRGDGGGVCLQGRPPNPSQYQAPECQS